MHFFISRCLFSILIIMISIIILFLHITRPLETHHITKSLKTHHITKPLKIPQITPPDPVELLVEQLFDSSTTLDNVQRSWNKLMKIWKKLLLKFVNDACDLCHSNDRQCTKSVNINLYINYMNQSYYPFDETKLPHGMGLYFDFDLKFMRSLNNSILSSDVTPCDYFHMFQLMIFVQLVLHQKEIDYFITKGTFIGSLRHHDVIPWDTDIDIFIPYSSVFEFMNSFKQLNVLKNKFIINTTDENNDTYDGPLYRKDLVVYQYRNVHRVTSYKIFSIRSSRINRAEYRWPKIDVFPYQESRTHIFAFPRHKHNLGTMNYLSKVDVHPIHLRPLGPLLVPSPRNLRQSLSAMVRLGRANLFRVCEGNTFLHRQNRASDETWRIPCRLLSTSYPFVKSFRDSDSGICTEKLLFDNNEKCLSLYKYRCDENLPRTLN